MNFGMILKFRDALARVPDGNMPFVRLFHESGLTVELYTPKDVDRQQPHTRDEIYIVARGGAEFVVNGKRHVCGPNDLLFVPAHAVHHFEGFTEDFAVWVLFFGEEKRP